MTEEKISVLLLRRYGDDVQFRTLVEVIYATLRNYNFTVKDYEEAVRVAHYQFRLYNETYVPEAKGGE